MPCGAENKLATRKDGRSQPTSSPYGPDLVPSRSGTVVFMDQGMARIVVSKGTIVIKYVTWCNCYMYGTVGYSGLQSFTGVELQKRDGAGSRRRSAPKASD